jgi:Tfp pilus assembly protein PilF
MSELPGGYRLLEELSSAPGARVVRAQRDGGEAVQLALVDPQRIPVPRASLDAWARSHPDFGVLEDQVWAATADASIDLAADLRSLSATRVELEATVADLDATRVDPNQTVDLDRTYVQTDAAASFDTALGSELFAGFRIDGTLGKGGMGVVYRAWDPHLQRPVAIKMVLSQFLGPEGKERFLSEARAASRITHPNVVTVYSAGEVEGNPWMAMELVEGENLRERIGHDPPDWRQSVRWVVDLLDGLAPLHEQGILHRDIKPDNVLVAANGEVKLMDFGLAKGAGAEDPGGLMGTVFYMSPEQARSEDVTAPTDVFSMGVMLYEMLSGQLPFTGDDIKTVLDQVCNAEAPALSMEDDSPVELELVLARALAKDREARFADAAEFRDALRQILDADARAAAVNRRRWILGSIAAVIVLSVAGVWVGSMFVEPEIDRAWIEEFNELAIEELEAGEIEEARAKVQAAVTSDPAYALGWHTLGEIEKWRQDWVAADSLYARAAVEDPEFAAPWFGRGTMHESLGGIAAAEEYYRTAIEVEPGAGLGYSNLGHLLMDLGRVDDADEILEAGRGVVAIEHAARPYILRASGRLEVERGDGEAALRYLAEARAGLPTEAWPAIDELESRARALLE